MKSSRAVLFFAGSIAAGILLSGCATTPVQPATVGPEMIQNPTLGFNGYIFRIPPELKLADFLQTAPHGTGTEQMSARLFQCGWNARSLSSDWGWERFSEAFPFRDPEGKTCFLFSVQLFEFCGPVPMFSHMLPAEKRQIYNAVSQNWNIEQLQPVTVGGRQALYADGCAFEKDGRLYKTAGEARRPVVYASCYILGDTRDFYAMIGCSDPKDAALLKLNMQRMMAGLSFP